jgi:hypothetical protein
MKLKLDLHPIYNDSHKIESSLQDIIDEAVTKRATEVEVIPGKGSGALKKTVLRFLDRPDVKARYHRIEKDGDNWGRLFIHFRPPSPFDAKPSVNPPLRGEYTCFCCQAAVAVRIDRDDLADDGTEVRVDECPSCGSPNRLTVRLLRRGDVRVVAESGYE